MVSSDKMRYKVSIQLTSKCCNCTARDRMRGDDADDVDGSEPSVKLDVCEDRRSDVSLTHCGVDDELCHPAHDD
jgi:hypothetical protein